MIALLPGRGRRRFTRAGETARADRLQAELDKATEFIHQLCAINREVIAERDLAQSQARQYLCTADELADELIDAERTAANLAEELRAARAQRSGEDTLTIPALKDVQARFDGGDGLRDTDEAWCAERSGEHRRPPVSTGPVVQVLHVKDSPDLATALPAALDPAERTAPPVRAR